MKNLVLLLNFLSLLFFAQASTAQCPSINIVLTSQSQIDSFAINYPNCTNLKKNLKILEQYQEPITNINGLSPIQTITGLLKIKTKSLLSLNGLNNLSSIGEDLILTYNSSLKNLDELSNLTNIGHKLEISDCSALEDIKGLSNVGPLYSLKITYNGKLNECAIAPICNHLTTTSWTTIKKNALGCESKETVSTICNNYCAGDHSFFTQSQIDSFINSCSNTASISILGDEILNLQGFSNIDSIKGDLTLQDCSNLSSLQGLNNIKSISGDLIIKNCDALINLEGLNLLHNIKGDFIIQNCDTLHSLEGLSSLSHIKGNLLIGKVEYYNPYSLVPVTNPQLSELTGLEALDSIGGDFYIISPTLQSFNGLGNLKKVAGKMLIEGCGMVDFQGLGSLIEADAISLSPVIIGQYQSYEKPIPNSNLVDFSGLDNLIHLNHLNIGSNPSLLSFNGLQNITKLKSLRIILNTAITNFEGLNNLTEISENLILGNRIFLGQMYGSYSIAGGTNIHSFSGLENIKTIGNFKIMNTNKLFDFTGLDNLDTINGTFQIGGVYHHCGYWGTVTFSNDTLNSFKGLSSVKKIGGDFIILGENKIKNLNYLSSLDSIAGKLLINTSNIESLSGISSLSFVNEITLGSYRNSLMNNFQDLSQLSFIDTIHGNLNIIDLDTITDLTGLNNLKYVQKSLVIAGNEHLENLDALSQLEYVGENFSLGAYPTYQTTCDTRWGTTYVGYPHPNPSLQSIAGLSNLKTIDSTFTFAGNDLIESLTPLTSLESIGDDVHIGLRVGLVWNGLSQYFQGNKQLKDISILQNVAFSKRISLQDNPKLANLSGIGNRDSIHLLQLEQCDSLLDLTGLDGIKYINQLEIGYSIYVSVLGNKNIQSLDGLDENVYVEKASIRNNPNLTTCRYDWLCDAILREKAYVKDNGIDCSTTDDLGCNDLVLSGNVYYDLNQNKHKDNNEPNLPNQKIFFNPPGQTIITNQNGNFFQYCDSGSVYTLNWVPDTLWQLSTDSAQYTVTYLPGASSNNHKQFGLFPAFPYHSATSRIYSSNTRCNEVVHFYFRCENSGTYVETGKVEVIYDPLTSYVSSDTTIIVDSINHRLTWTFDSLYQFKHFFKSAKFQMPDQNSSGTKLNFKINIYRADNGSEILLDSYTYTPTILCSFDPNDKQVMPSGERDEHYTLHDQKLTYTIRFQNTGNAEAIDVRILDTIDTDLNINTLRIINSSFPVQTSIKDQAVEFYFKNISLPDSTSNEAESHGYVTYEIQPMENLSDYTEIKNTAHIIFDFNEAIITNSTTNTMVTMIPVALKEIEKLDINIQPNPANNIIYISTGDNQAIHKVMIYNTLGQLSLAQKGNTIDISHLPKGVYTLTVEIDGKIGIEKLVID